VAQWCLREGLQDFIPQALSTLINAYAKTPYRPPPSELLHLIAATCEVR
jgi:hypothetical protein